MDPFQQQPSPVDGFASRVSLPLLLATAHPQKVDISYYPLSDASEEAVRLSQLDDLAMSYNVCINLMRRTISSFSFKDPSSYYDCGHYFSLLFYLWMKISLAVKHHAKNNKWLVLFISSLLWSLVFLLHGISDQKLVSFACLAWSEE